MSPKVLEKILGRELTETGEVGRTEAPVRESVKAHIEVGLDSIVVSTFLKSANSQIIEETTYVDEWGRLFSRRMRGQDSDFYVRGYLTSPEKYEEFARPDPYDPWRVNQYIEATKAAGKDLFIIPGVGTIYEVMSEAIGKENFFRYMFTNPSFIERALKDAANFTIEQGEMCIDAGAEVVLVYDDYAYKHGPDISPKHWRRFVFPHLKSAADAFHRKGSHLLIHTDGNILPIMDMITEAGVDGIQPLEPAAGMHLDELKQKWGGKICLIGNIDVVKHALGSSDEIARDVKEAIRAAAPGGGYILCSGHYINETCRPENFITQVEVGKKYGRYPRY